MPTARSTFGRAMLAEWALDPQVTYLNHGTVGAVPRRVLEAQRRIQAEIEARPSQFLLRELTGVRVGGERPGPSRMRVAASQVAPFLGVRADDLGFVENATAGVNAVLRSLEFGAGDEILVTNLTYGAVVLVAQFVARRAGAHVRVAEMPYPIGSPSELVDAFAAAITPRTRLAIVDHITSESALVLPLKQIAAACRERGVAVLADGAHGPGAIPLDIPCLGVDWYAANLHKWAWSPRSCGILWAAPDRQHDMHPAVISWALDQGFALEFDVAGTRDPSAFLGAAEGIAYMRELGVESVQAYNHALAWEGGNWLASRWGTALGVPESMVGTMVTVPLPERAGSTRHEANALRDALLFEDHIEIQLHEWEGRLWVRLSAQVYNEMSDVERLGQAVLRRI